MYPRLSLKLWITESLADGKHLQVDKDQVFVVFFQKQGGQNISLCEWGRSTEVEGALTLPVNLN